MMRFIGRYVCEETSLHCGQSCETNCELEWCLVFERHECEVRLRTWQLSSVVSLASPALTPPALRSAYAFLADLLSANSHARLEGAGPELRYRSRFCFSKVNALSFLGRFVETLLNNPSVCWWPHFKLKTKLKLKLKCKHLLDLLSNYWLRRSTIWMPSKFVKFGRSPRPS